MMSRRATKPRRGSHEGHDGHDSGATKGTKNTKGGHEGHEEHEGGHVEGHEEHEGGHEGHAEHEGPHPLACYASASRPCSGALSQFADPSQRAVCRLVSDALEAGEALTALSERGTKPRRHLADYVRPAARVSEGLGA
jgi:hypothetical protein